MKEKLQWRGFDYGQWQPVGETCANLKPGIYSIDSSLNSFHLVPAQPKHDNIIATGMSKTIADTIDKFLVNRPLYQKLGFLHKRGVLMVGTQGSGKSMTIALLQQHMIPKGGVTLLCPNQEPGWLFGGIRLVRDVHVDMPILAIMEDIEVWYDESPEMLLAMMDGQYQTDNIVFLATSNFPEKLDGRLLDRPGRFDSVFWVSPPEIEVRRAYLRQTIPTDIPDTVIEEMAKASEGLFIAHLRELICGTLILGKPIAEVVADLRAMQERSNKNTELKKQLEAMQQKMPPALARQFKQMTEQIGTLATAVAGKAA